MKTTDGGAKQRAEDLDLDLTEAELLEHFRTTPLPKSMDWLPPRPRIPFARLFDFECCMGGADARVPSTSKPHQTFEDDSSNRTFDTESVSSHTAGTGTAMTTPLGFRSNSGLDPTHHMVVGVKLSDDENDSGCDYLPFSPLYHTDSSPQFFGGRDGDEDRLFTHYDSLNEPSFRKEMIKESEKQAALIFWQFCRYLLSIVVIDTFLSPRRSPTSLRGKKKPAMSKAVVGN